jgi:hypothetical protein
MPQGDEEADEVKTLKDNRNAVVACPDAGEVL